MEDLIRALGGEPVIYPMRNECCGGYVSVESPALAEKNSNSVIENAKAQGAEMIITASFFAVAIMAFIVLIFSLYVADLNAVLSSNDVAFNTGIGLNLALLVIVSVSFNLAYPTPIPNIDKIANINNKFIL